MRDRKRMMDYTIRMQLGEQFVTATECQGGCCAGDSGAGNQDQKTGGKKSAGKKRATKNKYPSSSDLDQNVVFGTMCDDTE